MTVFFAVSCARKHMPRALPVLALLAFLINGPQLNGQTLLAGWDFQTTTNGGTAIAIAPDTPTTILANFGTQAGTAAIYLNGTNGSSAWITSTTGNEVTAFAGTSNNAGIGFSTTTTGAAALGLQGGSGTSANGKSLGFSLSMTGYTDLTISYSTQKTNTGFNANQWAYSLDGIEFTNFGTVQDPSTSFSTITLSALTATDNAGVVFIRYTLNGATAANGNNRLDNIQFNATAIPEPSTYAAITGAAALLGAFFYRRRAQRQLDS